MVTVLGLYAFVIAVSWEWYLDAEICRYF